MFKDSYCNSCGVGQIHVCRWEPKGTPKFVVQIIHGIADYAERYNDFANFLTDMGALVVAEDHMGHGRSVTQNDVKGYFSGGWFSAVEDSYQLLRMTQAEFPNTPYILFGHSMGSFMAQTILQLHPSCGLSGCVLCGSGWQSETALSVGIRLCESACRRYGETVPSPILLRIVFGAYNLRVEHRRTPYDWVCRNHHVVDELICDPLCSHKITTGLMRDMLTGISFIQKQENIEKMNKDMPILLIAGGDDPVGSYGDGIRKIADHFLSCGISHVTTHIYPLCRHEILNELNRLEVYTDMKNWIFSLISK